MKPYCADCKNNGLALLQCDYCVDGSDFDPLIPHPDGYIYHFSKKGLQDHDDKIYERAFEAAKRFLISDYGAPYDRTQPPEGVEISCSGNP